ncbi:MAG: N-glycosylase/DNA lyase [Ignavibacteriales bacterium]|nr:N-glycosylase/DNA lyase [Ignavibacteriales bacterium]
MVNDKLLITNYELQKLHLQFRKPIRQRLKEFSQVQPSEYFYELAYCLLTPQTKAESAGKAIEVLKEKDFQHKELQLEKILHNKDYYIRFHNIKAKHLRTFKENFPKHFSALTNGNSPIELREYLVNNVLGLGYKEASHFLRNIGNRNLAIIDRHILKGLVRCGVLKSLPKTLSRKTYLEIEKKFLAFSEKINIPMDELDLLFWSMQTGEILK